MCEPDSAAASSELILRELGAVDLEQACALSLEMGWNQVAADWEIFLDLGTGYGLFTDAQQLAATCCTLPYDRGFAWISMLIVRPAWRRQGLGTRLFRHCYTSVQRRGLVPVLDATDAGHDLYERLGFRDAWRFTRYEGNATGMRVPDRVGGLVVRPVSEADLPAIVAMDAEAFGAGRDVLVGRLWARFPQAALVAERQGDLCGFVLARDGARATQIGPLTADEPEAASLLLQAALGAFSGPAFVDVPDARHDLVSALGESGFQKQRSFTRMIYGSRALYGDSSRLYVLAGPELG